MHLFIIKKHQGSCTVEMSTVACFVVVMNHEGYNFKHLINMHLPGIVNIGMHL